MKEEVKTEIKRPAAPPAQDGRPPMHRRRYEVRRKVCRLCVDKVEKISYKNIPVLKTFMMDSGKIISRRITGTCARHQRQVTRAIKRNRTIAALPYEMK
ncbi:MAG: 30S ribosomal protein S18 [Elusimicrobiales bacterium]